MSSTHRRRSALAALALTLTAAGVAHADGVRVRFAGGETDGALAQGAWQTVRVEVSNPPGAPPLDATVHLQLRDNRAEVGSLPPVAAPVRVAPGETAPVFLRVFLPSDWAPAVQTRVVRGDGATVASATTGDPRIARWRLSLLSLRAHDDQLIALQSLSGRRFGVRNTVHGLALTPNRPRNGVMEYDEASPMQVVGDFVDRPLPTTAAAYGQFAVVLLGRGARGEVVGPVRDALRGFVRRGGIVLDGAGSGLVSEGWGVVVPAAPHLADPAALERLLRSRVGMRSTSSWYADPTTWPDEMGTDPLAQSVLRGQGLSAPPVGVLLGFLAFYLLLAVPGQYLLLKRLDRREWAWFVTPALAVGFSVAAYAYARQGRADTVFHNTLVVAEMGAGDGAASALGFVGLYSPVTGTYDVSVEAPDTVAWSGASTTGFAYPDRATVRGIAVGQWAMRSVRFRSDGVRIGDGVAIESVPMPGGGGVRVTVRNRTGRTIEDVGLSAGYPHATRDRLEPGASWMVELRPQGDLWFGVRDMLTRNPSGESAVATTLANVADVRASMRVKAGVGAPGIVLTGRIAASVVPVRIEGAPSQARAQNTWIVVHAPLP